MSRFHRWISEKEEPMDVTNTVLSIYVKRNDEETREFMMQMVEKKIVADKTFER